ncbi:MAG: hypothetical protein ACT6FB_03815 [Methanosarcinaceae archaeon]
MQKDFLLIGIDGGATKVSGWEVKLNEDDKTFTLGGLHEERSYIGIPGYLPDFKPVDIAVQLKERGNHNIKPTKDEEQQAAVYVEACAQVIESIVEQSSIKKVLIGLGMPGLKSEDKRGISVVANGPRMIRYSNQLEKRLEIKNIKFAAPIHHLGSDADYCGIGENYSQKGLFRKIANAYYLGGGTGAADAMKLDNKLIPFDQTKDWIAKCWEMKSNDGRSLERFASAGGIQSIYADLSKTDIAELNKKNVYPLQIAEFAVKGGAAAKKTFELVAANLALLLYERITTLYSGWQSLFDFVNSSRPPLKADHPFIGKVFERIIIGQRLGELFDDTGGGKVLKEPFLLELNSMIQNSTCLDTKAKQHYIDLQNIIVTSKLREAPAIGAGIDAYFNSPPKSPSL